MSIYLSAVSTSHAANGGLLGSRDGSALLDDKNALISESIAASIDEVIREMLGEAVVEAFYALLYDKGISRKNLPTKLQLLCSALNSTFGTESLGIQREIARQLFSKLRLAFSPTEGASLIDYVEKAKETMRTG